MNPSYTFLQFSFVMIMSIGILNHVLVIPVLLGVSGRDAWLSAIISFALLLPLLAIISAAAGKIGNKPLMHMLKNRYGRTLAFAISSVFVIYLLLSAAVTSKDLTTWTNSSYLPETPPFVIAATFIGLAYATAANGIRSIVYSSMILLPFVVLLGFFVSIANIPHKDYGLLFPLFEHGVAPMWRGITYAGSGLVELVLLLFMQQYLDKPMKFRGVFLLGLMLIGLTIGPLMGGLSEFGPLESKVQRYPAFEEWRLIKIGTYFEHVDFLSIFQWLSGAFVRLSFTLFLIGQFFNFNRWAFLVCSLLTLGLVMLPVSDISFVYYLRVYYFPVVFVCMIVAALVLLLLLLKRPAPSKSNKVNPA
ncbi:GerAB/ArcD/ProY family transporter [Cohnella soli]|uniref:Endospore germination permease n=1 Tax=Cohnella soli TaxID=425005 RepID=A0ABW0HTR5_9BACL